MVGVAGGILLRLDALGAFFLVLVGMVAAPAALYGVGYSAGYAGRYSLRGQGVALNAFLLATSLVPLADNVVTFLLAWEGMSLTSYFLVLTDHEDPETVGAGNWYLGMTQVGLAFLLAAFLGLGAAAPSLDFADLRAAAAASAASRAAWSSSWRWSGFGSKAGLIPLHVWLPRAHPAAPSHVSALMSGVMIKIGHLRPPAGRPATSWAAGPPWWGVLLLALGRRLRGAAACSTRCGARPQAAARLSQRREHRHHPARPRRGHALPSLGHAAAGRARARRPRCCTC